MSAEQSKESTAADRPFCPDRRAPQNDVRWAADRLQRRGRGTSFRREATLRAAPDDQRIVRQAVRGAKAGDPEAIRYLYLRYADNVYGYVCSILRDEQAAADVTQRVFAKLMTRVAQYEDRGTPFASWLLRMAHHVAIDHVRARTPIPTEEVRDHDDGGGEAAADRSLTVQAALRALPDDQRNVLVLRHVIGLTPNEIADRLGRTESSVHGLHHRGRRAFRRELEVLGCAPSTLAAA
jgi:RNA polymerase sigma-70 factor (ECF subfamily)